MSRAPIWSAAGLEARPVIEHRPQDGVLLRRPGQHGVEWLGAELSRSLAHWLLWVVGDAAAPADPDAVRAALDAQRAALRHRSASNDTTEDFRAGLAWADHALDAIAAAAGAPTPGRTR